MREILSLHVGQAGIQMGNSIWELLSNEHRISYTGRRSDEDEMSSDLSFTNFFETTMKGKYAPRAVFADLEPTVADEIRTGIYKDFYHPDNLISGTEDAANNFARGFFTMGKLFTESVVERFRKNYEMCDSPQAMFIFRSLGGGSGSGFTSSLFEDLLDYGKLSRLEIPIYPSPTLCSSIVEPYNCILAQHFCMEDVDISMMVDNEAMYDVLSKYVQYDSPTFSSLNRIIAQTVSSLTANLRYENILGNDIMTMQTNLVPYPRIHFPLINYAPLMNKDKAKHEDFTVERLTRYIFERDNQLIKCDTKRSKFMSCCLLYRGEIGPQQVYQTLMKFNARKEVSFIDWCPTGFKVSICFQPPIYIEGSLLAPTKRSVTMLSNSSAIAEPIQRITHRFHLLYSKRSYVHWFVGEGMEENEFTEALYNIGTLVKDYMEVSRDTKDLLEHDIGNEEGQTVNINIASTAHDELISGADENPSAIIESREPRNYEENEDKPKTASEAVEEKASIEENTGLDGEVEEGDGEEEEEDDIEGMDEDGENEGGENEGGEEEGGNEDVGDEEAGEDGGGEEDEVAEGEEGEDI